MSDEMLEEREESLERRESIFLEREFFSADLSIWLVCLVDADYVKEQGNGYAKTQDFINAIKCYSKSISLSPNADAYASRAVAYLEVGRFHDAEDDCTEALTLNVGYCKAYVHRAMARKELGNLEGALEDVKHALSLEPDSEEVKKSLAEIESLYEKAFPAENGHGEGVASADVEMEGLERCQLVPYEEEDTN